MTSLDSMRFTAVLLATLVCGCAQMNDARDAAMDAKLSPTRDAYVQCVNAEADRDSRNPAGAEDIAVAAHGTCWPRWDAYRQAAYTTYAEGARTRDEKQLAHDKADAELRQFELETRRSVVARIVQRTLTRKP